jgi:hypothetical protein
MNETILMFLILFTYGLTGFVLLLICAVIANYLEKIIV